MVRKKRAFFRRKQNTKFKLDRLRLKTQGNRQSLNSGYVK